MRTLTIFFVLALTFYGHWAAAQHPHGGATTQPVELHPGLGNYQHPITTKNADAQTHFNQGLILLYGFNHFGRRLFENDNIAVCDRPTRTVPAEMPFGAVAPRSILHNA